MPQGPLIAFESSFWWRCIPALPPYAGAVSPFSHTGVGLRRLTRFRFSIRSFVFGKDRSRSQAIRAPWNNRRLDYATVPCCLESGQPLWEMAEVCWLLGNRMAGHEPANCTERSLADGESRQAAWPDPAQTESLHLGDRHDPGYQEDVDLSTSPIKSASGINGPVKPYNGSTQWTATLSPGLGRIGMLSATSMWPEIQAAWSSMVLKKSTTLPSWPSWSQ